MNAKFEIQDQGANYDRRDGGKRFRVWNVTTNRSAAWYDTREEAEAAIAAYATPARRTASRRAYDRGMSYGVNGQVWDDDIY